jgi:fatty-acyl-CoA synthase
MILERARRLYRERELVSAGGAGISRTSYGHLYERACRLANALRELGVKPGERVGTLGWNTAAHLELYFAVPCCGAVLHTLNLRLPPEQIAFVANHAEDKVLFVDQCLAPLVEKLRASLPHVREIVVMNEEKDVEAPFPALHYEQLLAQSSPDYEWPILDENSAAAMCYTSGTTGHPKGCVYSHRSMTLHSMGLALGEVFGLRELDSVLPIVPMFHANAWGIPYCAAMVGARQIMPGPNMQPAALAQLIESERVTVAAGVPTIWIGLLAELERKAYDFSSLRLVVSGGAAAPKSLIAAWKKRVGITLCHAWGMTETSPLGSVSRLRSDMLERDEAEQYDVLALQGTPVPGVEIRGIDAQGEEIPWDGATLGELQVRGPWIVSGYYRDPQSADSFMDGWLRTGDVVTISPQGYIHIVDRTKDLIKSGGEWISSVDLEAAIMAHPQVLEAAVVAVPHETWLERPLACVVAKSDHKATLSKQEILDFLRTKVAEWWMPDDVVFLEAIPKTSVGKFDKKVLRAQFQEKADRSA